MDFYNHYKKTFVDTIAVHNFELDILSFPKVKKCDGSSFNR
jgi:hypothetical protein